MFRIGGPVGRLSPRAVPAYSVSRERVQICVEASFGAERDPGETHPLRWHVYGIVLQHARQPAPRQHGGWYRPEKCAKKTGTHLSRPSPAYHPAEARYVFGNFIGTG